MLKTYLYIPEELDKQVKSLARDQKKSKAHILREAIKEGIELLGKPSDKGALALLELSKMAEKLNIKGPRDLSVNHDYYLWGGKKKNSRIKA